MTDDEILLVLDNEIALAKELIHNQVARERQTAYDLYHRKALGNEVEGRSQVITADVAMAIDTTVPALMEMFVASDKAVEFTPRKAEDVVGAEQATDVGNYVFYSQNRGYQLVYDALFDGLVQKTGALKWRWEKNVNVTEETYLGLNDQQFVMLQQDPAVEIVQYAQSQIAIGGQPQSSHDVLVKRKKEGGQCKIESIPVDELLLSPKSRGYDLYEAPFVCHAPLLTYSDLMELGVDPKLLEEVGDGDDDMDLGETVTARLERLGLTERYGDSPDLSQRRYRYYESYLKIDVDGDGIAELRKICKVGSRIVHNDPTDHIPMAYWCPKTMPHEPIGQSMADDVGDIQLLNTTLWRAGLDALYISIAPRLQIDVEANTGLPTLEDAMTVRPGGIIRARTGTVNQVGQMVDLGAVSNMIEFSRQEGDQRTGAYRYGQGLDPNAVNKTATVATLQNSSMQARLKIYARNFAEQCLIPMFKGILYLLSKNQQEALTIRLRNEFVPVDPRAWNTEYDMSVNVGLGTGTKEQQGMALQAVAMAQQAVAGSPFAQQLLTPKNVFNVQKKAVELAGYKDPEQFWTNPDKAPPPQPQPPVQVQVQQMKGEQAMQETQAEAQVETQKNAADFQLEQMKMNLKKEYDIFKAELDAQVKLAIGQMQAAVTASRPVVVSNDR